MCPDDQTCRRRVCVAATIDPTLLPAYPSDHQSDAAAPTDGATPDTGVDAGPATMDLGTEAGPPPPPSDAGDLPSPDAGAVGAAPQFLLIADTSGSMDDETGTGVNRCGYDRTRANDLKCALATVLATGVPAVFGLARFHVDSCVATGLPNGCEISGGHGDYGWCISPCSEASSCGDSCWPEVTEDPADPPDARERMFNAADIIVPIRAGSEAEIAVWTDATCAYPDNPELDVSNWTPLAGSLGTALRYFDGRLGALDPALESPVRDDPLRACRRYSVVLLTDGQETCGGDPTARARDLLSTTVDGVTYAIHTHVIGVGIAGDDPDRIQLGSIAAAGSGGAAIFASTEDEIIGALYEVFAREGSSCRACGAPSQECCGGLGGSCTPGAYCVGSLCRACGGSGQECCGGFGGSCSPGLMCFGASCR